MTSRFRPSGRAAAIAVGVLFGVLAVQSASAQGGRSYYRPPTARSYYYQLPTVVRVTPGMARILRPRCDRNYPMHESMPCGTATGGPVGGLGS